MSEKMTEGTMIANKMYNEKEAAEILGIAPATLRGWRSRPRANCPEFTKIGRSVRYSGKSLRMYIERNTQK